MPKENFPDISVPMTTVRMVLRGISAEDCDKLLIRPVVREVSSINGVKEVSSYAMSDTGYVVLEFYNSTNMREAIRDTSDRVNNIRGSLPSELSTIEVNEVNFSLFPVISVILRSDMPYSTLKGLAEDLSDEISSLSDVMESRLVGSKDDIIEIITRPEILEGYEISLEQIMGVLHSANTFRALGDITHNSGQLTIRAKTTIDSINALMKLPVKINGSAILRVQDVADIRRGYRNPTNIARVNGRNAIAIEVSKNINVDIARVTHEVKAIVERAKQFLPENLEIVYSQDASTSVADSVRSLENNVLFSIMIVVLIITLFSNLSSALLVALTIPGSFFFGIAVIDAMGYTINMMVLFSLMLSVGILVDAALVVVEYADRLLFMKKADAFKEAAAKMFLPIVSSTATTIVVFIPLLFWPGITGQFLRYLPTVVILVMMGSLLMSLIFVPTIGNFICRFFSYTNATYISRVMAIEECRVDKFDSVTAAYYKALNAVLLAPKKFVFVMLCFCFAVIALFILFGRGVEFFPQTEPDNAVIMVKARGNLSMNEKLDIVKLAETKLEPITRDVRVIYSRTGHGSMSNGNIEKDIIGEIFLEFKPWSKRRKADAILSEALSKLDEIAGVRFEAIKQVAGPPKSGDIQILLTSHFGMDALHGANAKVREAMQKIGGFKDIKDNLAAGTIKFNIDIDDEKAVMFGMDTKHLADAIALYTNGLELGNYTGGNDDIDMVLRYDTSDRNLASLLEAQIATASGNFVAISDFVNIKALDDRSSSIERVGGSLALKINANVTPGLVPNNQIRLLYNALEDDWDPHVQFNFEGETKDMFETQTFLKKAFAIAIAGIAIVLLLTFNSVRKTLLVMTAILFSVIGVILGILITHSVFGIVMCGIGIITLAGIAVNNNILLIDMYDFYRKEGYDCTEAVIRSAVSRLRPILLTSITTALGLLPMVIGLNIDFLRGDITHGGPSSQFWMQLSSAISGGIIFSTVIALFFTPAALMLMEGGASHRDAKCLDLNGK